MCFLLSVRPTSEAPGSRTHNRREPRPVLSVSRHLRTGVAWYHLAMAMTWRPPDELDQRLDAAAFVTGQSKTALVTEAVQRLLDDHPQAREIERAKATRKNRST